MKAKAESLDHDALLALWDSVRSGDTPEWPPGRALEYVIIRGFQLELGSSKVKYPYNVTYQQRVGTIEQLDGVVYAPCGTFIIEVKDWQAPLDVEPLAKLRLRIEKRPPGTMGLLFSRGGYTVATNLFAQFASPLNVLLWNARDITHAITNQAMVSGLEKKYRHAVESGIPDFNLYTDAIEL